jgi:hypothetical protein
MPSELSVSRGITPRPFVVDINERVDIFRIQNRGLVRRAQLRATIWLQLHEGYRDRHAMLFFALSWRSQ